MRALLVAMALVVLWIGIDMVRLAKHRTRLPREVTDNIVFGRPVDPSRPARDYLESRFLVHNGAGSLVLGIVLSAAGCLGLLAAVFWLQRRSRCRRRAVGTTGEPPPLTLRQALRRVLVASCRTSDKSPRAQYSWK
jgi:hypothetical protein